MTKQDALTLIQSGRARALLEEHFKLRTDPTLHEKHFIVLGRFEGLLPSSGHINDDVAWTALAIRNDDEILKVEYHGFMVSHGGTLVIDGTVHSGGNAHQASSGPEQGIWLYDCD